MPGRGTLVEAIIPFARSSPDLTPLIDRIGQAQFVLLGEATHGTHEFYWLRAEITKQLIRDGACRAVAIEWDWPDTYELNCFVRGLGAAQTVAEALAGFERFPKWMWRNSVVRDFLEWLRAYNAGRPAEQQTGIYGLDLYSLHRSIHEVLTYLAAVDPEAAARARERYSCFEHFGGSAQQYGLAAAIGVVEDCEDAVVEQLVELQRRAAEYLRRDGRRAADAQFFAEQNARLVANAERYYRAMFRGRASSWNIRDRHMAETLFALSDHLGLPGQPAQIAVWAHNSHLGDARATEMGWHGELNVGQLVRERVGRDAVLVGFTTYQGTVTAAHDWDEPAQRMSVRPALLGSYERLFHDIGLRDFLVVLTDSNGRPLVTDMPTERLERAIGVIYRPVTERQNHYFHCRLVEQFDAVIHLDDTRALVPLDPPRDWHEAEEEEPPETYPTGI
ncbi:MAG: hypothetical protein KatS3mg060_3350 [Dehalococcoidia bacterium]|nr:MAG: hypothetical protein KatS3mg060_3350 [Dehalococcoidia bacterium]